VDVRRYFDLCDPGGLDRCKGYVFRVDNVCAEKSVIGVSSEVNFETSVRKEREAVFQLGK
jgi:hypothetical protein